jgi:hypothetical protein
VLVAGCGEDERVAYQRDLSRATNGVEDALDQGSLGPTAAVGPAEVERIAAALRTSAEDVDGLDAPDDVADEQLQLVRGLAGVADSFEQLADQLRRAESETERAELFVAFTTDERAEQAFDDLESAQDGFARAGLRVFDPPGK